MQQSISTKEMNRGINTCKRVIEKFVVIIASLIWLIASIYDLCKMNCFWSDYMLEIYSNIITLSMLTHILCPDRVKKEIYMYLGIITHTYGRGIVLILISLLFISDAHSFHKISSIILLSSGILLILLEICIPTPKDEAFSVPEITEQTRPTHITNREVKVVSTTSRNSGGNSDLEIKEKPESENPYEIPEDF